MVVVREQQAFLACRWRGAEAGRMLSYSLATGKAGEHRSKVSAPRELTASRDGKWVATVDRHTVLLWRTADFARPALALAHTKPLTCVAISSDGSKVAAGDATGRIVVWHDVAPAARARLGTPARAGQDGAADTLAVPPASTVHWHAHEVVCLTFSVDDAFLLSGGREAVLVMWDVASGNRTYLPRLGGPLLSIAACAGDAAKYAIRQGDNTLRVVNMAAMRVECSVHGLRRAVLVLATDEAAPPAPTPAAFQPRTGLLAVAGSQAVLQFYDVARDAHVDKLQLSVRNMGLAAEGAGTDPSARELVFSADGSVMATVETSCLRLSSAGGSGSEVIKFWERQAGAAYGSPYALVASAEDPHRSASGAGPISGLAYHPSEDAAVTTSGSEFRVWRRQQMGAKLGGGLGWRCEAVASYRGEPLCSPVFSPDGSLLAVAAGGSVTLWDALRVALVGTLTLPPGPGSAAPIRQLAFLPSSHFLVVATADVLAVLNVLAGSAVWSVHLAVGALAVDSSSDHFAVAVETPAAGGKEQAVVLFEGGRRQPLRAWLLGDTPGWAPPLQLLFALPGTLLATAPEEQPLSCSPLLVLSAGREYAILGTGQLQPRGPEVAPAPAVQGTVDRVSAFAAKYGQPAAAATRSAMRQPLALARPGAALLIDTPSHVLPPVQELCAEFLSRLLPAPGSA
eukprot:scaffold8.g1575.t1